MFENRELIAKFQLIYQIHSREDFAEQVLLM